MRILDNFDFLCTYSYYCVRISVLVAMPVTGTGSTCRIILLDINI